MLELKKRGKTDFRISLFPPKTEKTDHVKLLRHLVYLNLNITVKSWTVFANTN